MRNILLLFFTLLNVLPQAFSQCTDIRCTISEADKNKLYNYSSDLTVTLDIQYDKVQYPKLFVHVIHAVGPRPLNIKKFELTQPGSLTVPVTYFESSGEQALMVLFTEKAQVSSYADYFCQDSIRILEGYKLDAFWRKGVQTTYAVYVNNTLTDTSLVDVFSYSTDSITQQVIYSADEGFIAMFKVRDGAALYEFSVRVSYTSNTEHLEVYVYPNAMALLQKNYGIRRFEQIKSLTKKQRDEILKKYPQYANIFDPRITQQTFYTYDTRHIAIYSVSNETGVHFTGVDMMK